MSMRRTLPGVLYAEDFDAPEPAASGPEASPPEPVVLEPTFSLADLRHAAEHAREEALALALRDTGRTAAALKADALNRIGDALNQARAEAGRIAAEAAAATAETVLAAVAAVLPAFARRHGQAEASALLRLLLPAMSHEPRLSIRAHPSLVGELRDELAAIETDGQTVEWAAVETMPPGDLAVRWQNGAMVRDVAVLCAQVTALVTPGLTPSNRTEKTDHGH